MLFDFLNDSQLMRYQETGISYSIPTNFTLLDVLTGNLEYDNDFDLILNGGIPLKFTQQAGHSHSGKTSFSLKCVFSACDWWRQTYPDYDNTLISLIDLEDSTTIPRVRDLSNWSYEYLNEHFKLHNMSSLSEIKDFIMRIADTKEKQRDKFLVTTNIRDITGDFVKVWTPTFIILDSLPMIRTNIGLENLERDKEGHLKPIEEISGNMDAMRRAKDIVDFVASIKPELRRYGIYLNFINHIKEIPQINMYNIPKKILPGLKNTERLHGGDELPYQSFFITTFRSKEKLDDKNPIYGDDIQGHINEFWFAKNKGHAEGITFRTVFDKKKGYIFSLSDFEVLQQYNYGISGNPMGLYFTILPEIKFTRKTLYEKLHDNPLLQRALKFTTKMCLIYTFILDSVPPHLNTFAELPFEQRAAIMYNFTNTYPEFDASISQELHEQIQEGKNVLNIYKDYSNSILTPLQLSFLFPSQEGEVPMVPFGTSYFAKTLLDMADYTYYKDGDVEFIFPNLK